MFQNEGIIQSNRFFFCTHRNSQKKKPKQKRNFLQKTMQSPRVPYHTKMPNLQFLRLVASDIFGVMNVIVFKPAIIITVTKIP